MTIEHRDITGLIQQVEKLRADADRYAYLKAHMFWDDERDFGPGGRYWVAIRAETNRPDIDALIDSARAKEVDSSN